MTYNPNLGRWLEQDPIGFLAGDNNLYRYVGNSPTNATDPLGLVRAGTLISLGAMKQYLNDRPSLAWKRMEIVGAEAAWEVEAALAPHAIRLSVIKALDNLKITGVKPEVGDMLKSKISKADYASLCKQAGTSLEKVTTISGDSAERIKLGGKWELKIYKSGDEYQIAVGTLTESWEHWFDAVTYLRRGRHTNPPPNGDNAEEYLGSYVYDAKSLSELLKYKEKGYITQKQYDDFVKNGIEIK